ncbi:MAG: hypothetical protein EPN39_14225 [Chitinophagaceae bacterium]|nr:MAG: hypothetical protein EPN39_14225 [Chitinophagaceae bacterium]
MRRTVIIQAIAAATIILFVYASLSKLMAYPLFTAQLEMHPLLRPFAGWLAWAVPAAELLVAALLVIPSTRLMGLYGSAILLFMFTVYLTVMILTDKHLPCSCGGLISRFTWRQHIVFNLVFLAIAITGILLNRKRTKDIVATIHPNSSMGVN